MAGPAAPRPLRGKTFYLDLPSGRSARELAEAIRRLGGVTESFLSKEVSYVVSSSKEARRDKARAQPDQRHNAASEAVKATSPVPSTSKGSRARPHQKPPDTALISRGKELLQKAMKNQDTCSGSSILANARLWGVQVLHTDDMLAYTQQLLRALSGARKRCQKTEAKCLVSGSKPHKAGKLKPPFLKVEDQSRRFRPFHHQFKSFPSLNFLAPKTSSPFEPLKSLSTSCRARGAEGCPMRSHGEKSPRSTPVTVPKKRRGFCECCQETFEELQKHLQSPQHKRFALDDSQYALVDRIISQLSNAFVEQSEVPRCCLRDERWVPPAPAPGGIEILTAELGKEKEQLEQSAGKLSIAEQHDGGLKTKECPPRLPMDRVSNPGGEGLLESCSAGTGLPGGVCATWGTTQESPVHTGWGWVPDLGWGTCAAAACVAEAVPSSEPQQQQMPGSGHLPRARPVPRKRQLSSGHSTQVEKKPRLELAGGHSPCEQTNPMDGGTGTQGQVAEPGLLSVGGAGSLPLSTELCTRPCCSSSLDPCPHRSPGDPTSRLGSLGAASVGFGPPEPAAAGAVGEGGWRGANVSFQGKQLTRESEKAPRNVSSPDPESAGSAPSCPAGWAPSPKLPAVGARCCCSLCVTAAEKITPEVPELPGQSRERAPCPGLLRPPARAEHRSSQSSSESDWDLQLLSTLTGTQDSRIQPVDRDLLQRTHVNMRDSGYESQLCSVLKQKAEDKNCRDCCTETQGPSFSIFETVFGSWTI